MRRVAPAIGMFPVDPARRRWLLRLGGLGAVGTTLAAGVVWLGLSDAAALALADAERRLAEAAVERAADVGVRLRQVTVEGRERTRTKDILGALDLAQGAPLLAFDPAAARERLESLPWVKEARVERRLPGTVHIRLVERTPIALWQQPGDRDAFVMVDADGALIDDDIRPFVHLPVIAGPGAPEAASDLFTLLAAEPALARRVRAAVRVGKRRWDLWVDAIGPDGVVVRLPEVGAGAAVARLARLEREKRILGRDLAMIDLRLPDRLVVRVNGDGEATEDAPPRRGPPRTPLPLRGPARDA